MSEGRLVEHHSMGCMEVTGCNALHVRSSQKISAMSSGVPECQKSRGTGFARQRRDEKRRRFFPQGLKLEILEASECRT